MQICIFFLRACMKRLFLLFPYCMYINDEEDNKLKCYIFRIMHCILQSLSISTMHKMTLLRVKHFPYLTNVLKIYLYRNLPSLLTEYSLNSHTHFSFSLIMETRYSMKSMSEILRRIIYTLRSFCSNF